MDRFKYMWILLCLLMPSAARAQEAFSDTLVEKVKDYSNKNLTEKLFVHTDREFYLAGEILWFAIYEVDGSHHIPLPLNRVTYVELLDKNNQPVVQQKIAMKDGFGSGSILLSTSINSGTYLFRAYTNWMKNFGADLFFHIACSENRVQLVWASRLDYKRNLDVSRNIQNTLLN